MKTKTIVYNINHPGESKAGTSLSSNYIIITIDSGIQVEKTVNLQNTLKSTYLNGITARK